MSYGRGLRVYPAELARESAQRRRLHPPSPYVPPPRLRATRRGLRVWLKEQGRVVATHRYPSLFGAVRAVYRLDQAPAFQRRFRKLYSVPGRSR